MCVFVSNLKNAYLYLTQTAPGQSWSFEERFTLEGRAAIPLAQSGTVQKGKEQHTLKRSLFFKEDWAASAAATASTATARGSEARISLGWQSCSEPTEVPSTALKENGETTLSKAKRVKLSVQCHVGQELKPSTRS